MYNARVRVGLHDDNIAPQGPGFFGTVKVLCQFFCEFWHISNDSTVFVFIFVNKLISHCYNCNCITRFGPSLPLNISNASRSYLINTIKLDWSTRTLFAWNRLWTTRCFNFIGIGVRLAFSFICEFTIGNPT